MPKAESKPGVVGGVLSAVNREFVALRASSSEVIEDVV